MESFIAPDYKALKTDLVITTRLVPPAEHSFHDVMSQLIAALDLGSPLSPQCQAKAFKLNQEQFTCQIAFPGKLFEEGNMPQLMSIISSVLESPSIGHHATIMDLSMPSQLQASFPGPGSSIQNIRERIGISDRPLSSSVLRPKAGVAIKEYLSHAYHLWSGGCDIVEESGFMASTTENEFDERVSFLGKERSQYIARTGQQKIYIPNITAGTIQEMQRRARKSKEHGVDYILINADQIGLAAIASLRITSQELGLILCANKSGVGLNSHHHGRISGKVIALILRHLGINMLHIGSELNQESKESSNTLTNAFSHQAEHHQTCFPIITSEGSLRDIEDMIIHLGNDLIIEGSAHVFRHPDGVKAGAQAFQQAILAAAGGTDQLSAAEKNSALKRALSMEPEKRSPKVSGLVWTPLPRSSSHREIDTFLSL
ncbi:MAG: RuBisCO large subunit C-terminal-like domain-containing protein [bacterium]|nr:RuBisCO large subunit C-terminal-like domain-containing protein [bacterium]